MSNTKKAKEVEAPIGAPSVPNEPSTEDIAKKAIDEIMSQASAKASSLLQVEDDLLGRKPTQDPSSSPAQADFLPGSRVSDITYIPDYVEDEDTNTVRRCKLPHEYHYVWVEGSKRPTYRMNGYRFVLYDGGHGSGLAERGFLGTGLFERTADNHVWHADCYLMYCTNSAYERIKQDDKDLLDKYNAAAESDIHNYGYRYGVRTFKEENGQIIYN